MRPQDLKPAAPDPHGVIGSTVGRYHVLGFLGGGGMGIVYEAEDIELERKVALKFLPPQLSYDTLARERFIGEARAASRLDHPNICQVYEVGRTEGGEMFIAMRFYDGQTLKARIAAGDISAEEVIDYTRQIARGLEIAHANGIVHRDIKPANIMVTTQGIIKILDFGLAKVAEQQLTQTGATMGTVSYMSPEQAQGNAVDHRTDIWSLGIVLYEMLTGSPPFRGAIPESVIYSILNDEPTIAKVSSSGMPTGIEIVIEKCLEKNREDRYKNLDEFLRDLQEQFEKKSAAATRPIESRSLSIKRSTLSVVLLTAALFALLIWPASRRFLFQRAAAPPISVRNIAVLPFEPNPEDSREMQALADGISHLLAGVLVEFDAPETPITVISAADFPEYEVESANEAARMLGANLALDGLVASMKDVVALTLNMFDANTSSLIDTKLSMLQQETVADSLGFQEQLLNQVATLLGLPVPQKARQALQDVLPSEPNAYAFYLQGVGYMQRYYLNGYVDYAIEQFHHSLESDSLFALSHAGLCEALWEKWRQENDRTVADQALARCDRAESLVEDEAPALVSLASVFLRTDQTERATSFLRRAIQLAPDNESAYRWLGRVFESEGQIDSAIVAYRGAIELNPSWLYYHELGVMLSANGRYEDAATQHEYVRRLTPDNFLAYNDLAITYTYLNRVEEAENAFLRSSELRPDASLPRRNLGRLYLRQNEYDKAIASLEEALALNEGDWMAWNYLGHALYWNNDRAQANSAWQRLIELAEEQLEINPRLLTALTLSADAYAASGQSENAKNRLDQLADEPVETVIVWYFMGRAYEMLGERSNAFEYIERALQSGFDPYMVNQDPWLRDLREESRYESLIDQYLPNE